MTHIEKIQELANRLNREKIQAGGWSSDPSRFHFLNYGTFYVDYENDESYRCVLPESGSPYLWLPKGDEITLMGKQRVQLGLSFPTWVTVKIVALPKALHNYITEDYKLPAEADFWRQVEESETVVIKNGNHTITVNDVFYRFDGEVYRILKQILERGYGEKVVEHANLCSTGFCFFNLLVGEGRIQTRECKVG